MNEIIYTLVTTHITIICVTLYLHRGQAHLGIKFNKYVEHFMRFYLWLTTGMITKEWVAVHRKHHKYCETHDDPHSPVTHGILNVLFRGAFLYNTATKDKQTLDTYGKRTPDDYLERNLYSKHSRLGIILLLLIDILLFGYTGLIVWIVQMIWIPFWAAGVVNGLGHFVGYRNTDTKDQSKNLLPWGIVIGGEELHNNHHSEPFNYKLSRKWYEFDIGYMYLRILCFLNLARLR